MMCFATEDNTPYCVMIPRAFILILIVFFSIQAWIELIYSGIENPYVMIMPLIGLSFTFLPVIYVLYKLKQNIIFSQKSHAGLKKSYAGLILFLVALPSLIASGIMMAYIPPRFVNTTITMDMWHAEFNIPRPYLKDWELFWFGFPKSF